MDVSLYQAAAAMNASTRWQEVIAENLAASQIPGFKKQNLSFAAVETGYMGGATGAAAAKRATMPLAGASTSFEPGEMRATLVNTDLAVEGPGFFEVQLPDGSSGFTRDGEFRISTKGRLVTKSGMPVMGQNGLLLLDPHNTMPIEITPAGNIIQGGETKGTIKLTEFDDRGALSMNGSGFFVDHNNAAQPHAPNASSTRQGFLENANTSTMNEMGGLITAMRYYEANQKVIQSEDERVSRLINEVGNPT
jgi:flagellar basal body rod protein FlgG